MRDDYVEQLPDVDPEETTEWLDSLDSLVDAGGERRARFVLAKLTDRARALGVGTPLEVSTPYINTIPASAQEWFPGDVAIERRIRAYIRWNAAVMVVNANHRADGIGGHLATYASSAGLYELGFNHFFKGKAHGQAGDHVYFQGHAAPGIYSRAYLEGRFDETHLSNFRRELSGHGLTSYPHPWLMGDFWEFPTEMCIRDSIGTFSFTLSVGTITQSLPASSSTKTVGSSTFTDQLVVSGNDGAVTYVQTSGTPALTVNATGLIATSGALVPGSYTASGTTSDPNGDIGTFSFTLSVGTITQSLPTLSSVATTGSPTFTSQIAVIRNDGAVAYVQTSGTPALTVNATGLIATSGALAPGSYTARGTTSDTFGDKGKFVFTLNITAPAPIPIFSTLSATQVVGHAVAGTSVILTIDGAGFYGRPRITSHVGTSVLVTRDTGTLLVVKVTVRARSRNGIFFFTVTAAHGQSTRVKYNQR